MSRLLPSPTTAPIRELYSDLQVRLSNALAGIKDGDPGYEDTRYHLQQALHHIRESKVNFSVWDHHVAAEEQSARTRASGGES